GDAARNGVGRLSEFHQGSVRGRSESLLRRLRGRHLSSHQGSDHHRRIAVGHLRRENAAAQSAGVLQSSHSKHRKRCLLHRRPALQLPTRSAIRFPMAWFPSTAPHLQGSVITWASRSIPCCERSALPSPTTSILGWNTNCHTRLCSAPGTWAAGDFSCLWAR